jgi:hypothetical protein
VSQFLQGLGFTLKSFEYRWVVCKISMEYLHGKRTVALQVRDAVNRSHAAGGDEGVNAKLVEKDLTE